ncbi:hypothetical protein CFP65_4118 [Kitasatospora sp. MMS16-BH015]|nr:hypothetical protein CFP65_4118 [Kitasatospora sp. MMS16-BH015]
MRAADSNQLPCPTIDIILSNRDIPAPTYSVGSVSAICRSNLLRCPAKSVAVMHEHWRAARQYIVRMTWPKVRLWIACGDVWKLRW